MRWPWDKPNPKPNIEPPPVAKRHTSTLIEVYHRVEALKARAVRGVLTVSIAEYCELVCTFPWEWANETFAQRLAKAGITLEHAGMAGDRVRAMHEPPVYWPRSRRARIERRARKVGNRMADDLADLLLNGDPKRGAPGSGGLFS